MTEDKPTGDLTGTRSSGDPATERIQQFSIAADMRAGKTGEAVIIALAEAFGDRPEELPPLYETVDLDALDRLFCPLRADDSSEGLTVNFRYEGREVTLTGDGYLSVGE